MNKYAAGILSGLILCINAQAQIHCPAEKNEDIEDLLKIQQQITDKYKTLFSKIDDCKQEYQRKKLDYQANLEAAGLDADELGYEKSKEQFLSECIRDTKEKQAYENCLQTIKTQLQSALTKQRIQKRLRRHETNRQARLKHQEY